MADNSTDDFIKLVMKFLEELFKEGELPQKGIDVFIEANELFEKGIFCLNYAQFFERNCHLLKVQSTRKLFLKMFLNWVMRGDNDGSKVPVIALKHLGEHMWYVRQFRNVGRKAGYIALAIQVAFLLKSGYDERGFGENTQHMAGDMVGGMVGGLIGGVLLTSMAGPIIGSVVGSCIMWYIFG